MGFYKSSTEHDDLFSTLGGMPDLCPTKTSGCSNCKLYLKCTHPRLDAGGTGLNRIFLILPPPSEMEDMTGEVGHGGDNAFLRRELAKIGISFDDCKYANVIGCYTDNFKTTQVVSCMSRLSEMIKHYRPKLVIAFGSFALHSTVGYDFTRDIGDIEKWRGFCIPYRRWNCWLMHTYSATELVHNNSKFVSDAGSKDTITIANELTNGSMFRLKSRLFYQDLRTAYFHLNKPIPARPESIISPVVASEDGAVAWIDRNYNWLKENPNEVLVCDLETSGIKCYDKRQFIYSVGLLANPKDVCIAFRFTEKTKCAMQKLFSLNPKVIGSNFKFDYTWLKKKADIDAGNLEGDTVILAHLLDNRNGITSLKFQTYVRYGIAYEDTVHKFLKSSAQESKEHGSNAMNDILNAPIRDVLYYNSLDVIYAYFVFKDQYNEFVQSKNPNKWFAYKLFHKGSIAFAKIELNGFKLDLDKVREHRDFCSKKIEEIEENIKKEPFWKEWQEVFGDTASLLSDSQAVKMYQKHGYWPRGIPRDVKPVADREFLTKLLDQQPFFKYVLDYRNYTKMKNTYLENFLIEVNDDGRIRSILNLHTVLSYRTSSDSPNFQNIASRDPDQVQLLKSCFVPSDSDHCITCFDFSGLENAVSANITKDDYMISTIVGGVDMHLSNALFWSFGTEDEYKEMKKYDEEHHTKLAKALRQSGKLLSFGTLYGAGASTLANSVWKAMDDSHIHVTPTELARDRVIRILKLEEKYTNYLSWAKKQNIAPKDKETFFRGEFEKHCKEFLVDFWDKRMFVTKNWRTKTWEEFLQTGEIMNAVGTTIRCAESKNSALNAPAQGSGSCITTWCIGMLMKEIEKRGLHSKVILQIHDDIMCDVRKDELDEHLALQKYVMEELTQKAFPWITMPLSAESEISDTCWADKSGYDGFLDLYYKKYKNLT